jgi:arginine N-succinyltransferase
MLEEEGFVYDRYIDIFDGGPTVTAPTDRIRTVREATEETILEVGDGGKQKMLLAKGKLKDFVACCAFAKRLPRKGLSIDAKSAELLGAKVGDRVLAVSR